MLAKVDPCFAGRFLPSFMQYQDEKEPNERPVAEEGFLLLHFMIVVSSQEDTPFFYRQVFSTGIQTGRQGGSRGRLQTRLWSKTRASCLERGRQCVFRTVNELVVREAYTSSPPSTGFSLLLVSSSSLVLVEEVCQNSGKNIMMISK